MRAPSSPACRAVLLAVLCVALASACGGSDDDGAGEATTGGTNAQAASAPTPDPVPAVHLTPIDREVWTPRPADHSRIPVLLYHGIAPKDAFATPADAVYGLDPEDFAKQMVLLDTAGYETVTLDEFARFVRGEEVELPPRPLLITFDDGRIDSWTGSEGILRELGFNVVMFVDAGRVEDGDPEYLTWPELAAVEQNDRWELQLHSGYGHQQIQYGPAASDVGPYYAYKEEGETIEGWRERVFGDITWGEDTLSEHISGYRPLAFASVRQLRPGRDERHAHPGRAAHPRPERRAAARAADRGALAAAPTRRCARHDSNVRPLPPQGSALSPELRARDVAQCSGRAFERPTASSASGGTSARM